VEDLKMKLMIKLRLVETKKKRVCPACYATGEVTDNCYKCHGAGIINSKTIRYNVVERPVKIVKIDRDPKTGIIRYWENQSEFFYETTTHELNEYVPEVPFGVHLLHDSYEDAEAEAERVNKVLDAQDAETAKCYANKALIAKNVEIKNINIGRRFDF
jgi:hypothetical protein